jgi:hypothetical protein
MSSLVAGLAGGLIATIVMTITMQLLGDGGPPPTARLVATLSGGDPEDHVMPGMVLHVLYGLLAGVVFALGAPVVGFGFDSLGIAVGLGLAWGLVLAVGGMVFWMRLVIGLEPDRGMLVVFGTAHAVYGVVLGAFLGTGLLA